MNMQAMMKQAQQLQQKMLKTQEEINNTEFEGKASLVTVIMMGNKELKSVKINSEGIEKDDIEALEDMIMIAINDAMNQINKVTEEKMGEKINKKFNALCVEMEGASVAQVCYLCKIPFLVIRAISDSPYEKDNQITFDEFLKISSNMVAKFIEQFLNI